MSDESFRDTLYTIDKEGNRHWVYTQLIKGRFYFRRMAVAMLLMVIYVATPWIYVDGKQAVLLDLFNREFTFFGTTFWATDTIFLMLLLGTLGLSLFFFTALLGRVWCGWACPETVFLEFLFRPIERFFQGDAAKRKKLDASPWTLNKIWRKGMTHAVSAGFAWVLATTALAYFFGSSRMIAMIFEGPANHLSPFVLTLVMMGALGFQFGFFREQFCTVLCPYARFQSVMLDPNSLVIGYDIPRGEPRGKLHTGTQTGDCVDCGLCVRVCPTGIDIRNGLQLECVNCANCIDACDSVMEKLERPKGLIRYDTENRLLGRPSRVLRPRIVLYVAVLSVLLSVFFYRLATRQTSEFQVMRTKIPFVALPDGRITNQLSLHLANKGEADERYFVTVDNPKVELIIPMTPFPVKAGELQLVPVFVNVPKSELQHGKLRVRVLVRDESGYKGEQALTILGPE